MVANVSSGFGQVGRSVSSVAQKAAKASDVQSVKLKVGLKVKKKGKK